MKKHFLAFLLIALAPSVWGQRFVAPTMGACGGSPCYTTIQAAVDAASSGETITVAPGTYVESVTISGKNLTLISTGGKGTTTIQGVANGVGALVIDGSTSGFKLGTNASNGFTVIGFDNPDNASEVGAVVVKGGPHNNMSIMGNDIRAAGDNGFLHFFGTVINGLLFDGNTLSGQTYTGALPEQTCCSGTCYFNSAFSNVARSLFSLNSGGSGPVVSNLTFTNNLITGTAGAGMNGNILVQMTATTGSVTDNTFSGTTVSKDATCNRGSLRVRGTNFTVGCNNFNSAGLSGAGAYHVQFDQGDSFSGSSFATVNTLAGVAQYNRYDANPVAYYNPLGAGCPAIQRSVFVNSAAATTYAACGGTVQTVTGACTALPVEFISFEGKAVGNKVQLNWATSWERNADRFEIQRSQNATEFGSIGQIRAAGDATDKQVYGFTDEQALTGINYYRLRQVDRDGSVQISKIIAVTTRPEAPAIAILGNPTEGGRINLQLFNLEAAKLQLTDMQGRSLAFRVTEAAGGLVTLEPVSPLNSGMYLVRAANVSAVKIVVR